MDLSTLLMTPFLGQAAWLWLTFLALVVALLAFDLGVLHRKQREIPVTESLLLSGGYIAIGLAYGLWVWNQLGATSAAEYYTGYLIEKSLSMDNVFVIAMIFSYLAIPRALQHRVLFWGIIGVIVLRAIMIGLGATLVSQFSWILYVFGAFLLLTGLKMLFTSSKPVDLACNPMLKWLRRHMRVTDELHGNQFFVRQPDADGSMRRYATPLFLALILIETADLIFAVDSVPAIFVITQDPFIVYTSNIFAILGLRRIEDLSGQHHGQIPLVGVAQRHGGSDCRRRGVLLAQDPQDGGGGGGRPVSATLSRSSRGPEPGPLALKPGFSRDDGWRGAGPSGEPACFTEPHRCAPRHWRRLQAGPNPRIRFLPIIFSLRSRPCAR